MRTSFDDNCTEACINHLQHAGSNITRRVLRGEVTPRKLKYLKAHICPYKHWVLSLVENGSR